MSRYRHALPQLNGGLFLADGGLETSLIFLQGFALREFASFDLLSTPAGEEAIRAFSRPYIELAEQYAAGVVLDAATWRANPEWGAKLGYDLPRLAEANRKAVRMMCDLRDEMLVRGKSGDVVVCGAIGPRGDGYVPSARMTVGEAQNYHAWQVDRFADDDVDMLNAYTMNYVEEAVGVTLAAQAADVPVAVSFTLENDGKLPTGQTLRSAIEEVDAKTQGYAAYFMINCVHPRYFADLLNSHESGSQRIRGLRANASTRSHAELNESSDLDAGDPVDFGRRHGAISARLPRINVLGGCCGTDIRHIRQLAQAVAPLFGNEPSTFVVK